MDWNDLTDTEQLRQIDEESVDKNILIYKHSNRCGICTSVKADLESEWIQGTPIRAFYLDVIRHREVSDEVAKKYNVRHESPQALMIRDGKCVFHASHFSIRFSDLNAQPGL